jgi:hypothetical protein
MRRSVSSLYNPIPFFCLAHHWEVRAAQPATHLSSTPPNSNGLLPAFAYRTAHSSADTAAAASTARIATNRPAPGMGRARPGPNVHGAHPRKYFSTDKGMVANLCLEALGNFSSDLRTQKTCWHSRLSSAAVYKTCNRGRCSSRYELCPDGSTCQCHRGDNTSSSYHLLPAYHLDAAALFVSTSIAYRDPKAENALTAVHGATQRIRVFAANSGPQR